MAASSLALRAATVLGTAEGSSDEGGGKKPKTFTQYTVRVETQSGPQWTTAKRYTEFKELEAELELAGITLEGVKLPKKKLRNTSGVIAKRQESLQRWLSHAIERHPDHGILLQFLAPPAPSGDAPAAERTPPPDWMRMSSERARSPIRACWTARPASAPSRSTIWAQVAPAAAKAASRAAGLSS